MAGEGRGHAPIACAAHGAHAARGVHAARSVRAAPRAARGERAARGVGGSHAHACAQARTHVHTRTRTHARAHARTRIRTHEHAHHLIIITGSTKSCGYIAQWLERLTADQQVPATRGSAWDSNRCCTHHLST